MKTVRFFAGLVLIASVVTTVSVLPVSAQGGDPPTALEESNCRVPQEFLDYIDDNGGIEIFGYPISNAFRQDGILVQYFQNARIESHPENPVPYKVQLGLLGDELNYRDPAISRPRLLHSRRHFFPETGHIVSYAFLDFFKENGGIHIFGYPITEMHYEEGRIVQYFQRLKLSWYPQDTQSPVHISNLGEVYFETYKDNFPPEAFCGETVPQTNPRIVPQDVDLQIDVKYSVMTKRGEQEVSVLVRDGSGNALSDIEVRVSLKDESGRTLSSVEGATTNDKGFAEVSLPVEGASRGDNVTAEATINYGNEVTSNEIVFLIWW